MENRGAAVVSENVVNDSRRCSKSGGNCGLVLGEITLPLS